MRFEELEVWKRSTRLSGDIYKQLANLKDFGFREQITRAGLSVPSNIAEAWSKRRYEAHFISKLTDADGENGETDTWLDFAKDCSYLSPSDHGKLANECREIGAMLGAMITNPKPFLLKSY